MPGTPSEPERMSRPFPAKWPGKCGECGDEFEAGTIIRMFDGEPVIADCEGCQQVNSQLTAQPVNRVCRACFQVPAANGTCGCDV